MKRSLIRIAIGVAIGVVIAGACSDATAPTKTCISVGDTLAEVHACNTRAGVCDTHYVLSEKSTCGDGQ